jgi:hypothetical protein
VPRRASSFTEAGDLLDGVGNLVPAGRVASDLLGEAAKFHVEAGEIGEHLGAIGMRSLVLPAER